MAMRGVLKGIGWGTALLILLLAGAIAGVNYLWSHRPGQIAGRIAGLVNERVLGDGTRITIARVSGNPLQTVTLYDVQLHRHDSGGRWHRVVRAPEVRATYSLGGLLGTGRFEGRIEVLRPEVRVELLADSTFAIPTFRKGKGGGAPVEISDIEIRDGTVFVEAFKDGASIRDLDLAGGLRLEGGTARITVRSGGFLLEAPADTVTGIRGVLRVTGDRLFFEPLRVQTTGSEFEASGPLGFARRGALALDIAVGRLSMGELNRFQKISPPLRPGGFIRGRVGLSRGDGPLQVEWNVNGIVGPDSVAIFSGRGEIANDEFHGRDVLLRSGPVEASGSVDISLHDAKEYRLDLDVAGFDLSGPPLWPLEGDLPPTDLRGHVRLAGRGFGTGVTDLDVEAELGPGRVDLLQIDGGRTLFHILPDESFVVDSAEAEAGGGILRAEGRFAPEGEIALDAEAERFGLDAMQGYWKDVVITGRADLRGRLIGKTRTPQFTAAGSLSPFTIAEVVSDSVTVLSAEGDLMPDIVFDAEITADSLRLVGQRLEEVELSLGVAPGDVTFRDVAGRLDSLRFHGRGEMRQSGRQRQTLVVPDLAVDAGGHRWSNKGELRATLSADEFILEPSEFTSGENEIGGSLHSRRTGETAFSLESRNFDLKILEAFSSRRPLEGRADISAQIHGPQGALDGRLDMEIRKLRAGADSLDLMRAGLDVAGPLWTVRELHLASGGGHADIAGTIDWGAPLQEAVKRARARDREKLSGVKLDFTVEADSLPLPRLAGRADTLLASGVLDARATVKGTLGAPEIEGDVAALDGKIAMLGFDRVSGKVLYSDGVLTVSGGEIARGNTRMDASGFLPLELGLRWERPAIPESPMRFTLSADAGDLSLASELLPMVVGGASGTFRGLVVVGGTPRHPRASGRITITNASMRPLARSEVFHDGSAEISISEEGGIRLERLVAQQGKKGRIEAAGTFRSLRDFEFRIGVRNGILHQIESFDARLDGDFIARPDTTTFPGQVRPRISGTAVAKEVVIFQEFGLAPRPIEQTPWLFDLRAEVPNRLYVRNRSADLELGADGPITVRFDGGPLWLFGGTLSVLRGQYAAPQINARFNITSGTITMIALAGEDPQVDITAETRVPRLAQAVGAKATVVTVTVHLTGKLSAPTVTLESDDPDLSQSDIMQLLTYGRLMAGAQAGLTGPEVGSSVLVTQFLQLQFRDLLPGMGSAGITIEPPETGESSAFTVRVSQVVAPGLLLEYSQGLSLGAGQELGLEYRVSRNFFLRGGVVRDRILEQQIGDEYNLDFKLKLEY
jgi:hypothetical protein